MTATCQVRVGVRRCGQPALPGLPLCQGCFDGVLTEPDPGRRRTLASWGLLADSVLAHLAIDVDLDVRLRVARRPDLPSSVVDLMIDLEVDGSALVREVIAGGTVSSDQARRLIAGGEHLVVLAVASNLLTPSDVLDELVLDQDPDVVAAAVASRAGLRTSRSQLRSELVPTGVARPLHRRPTRSLPPMGSALPPPAPTSHPAVPIAPLPPPPNPVNISASMAAPPVPPPAPTVSVPSDAPPLTAPSTNRKSIAIASCVAAIVIAAGAVTIAKSGVRGRAFVAPSPSMVSTTTTTTVARGTTTVKATTTSPPTTPAPTTTGPPPTVVTTPPPPAPSAQPAQAPPAPTPAPAHVPEIPSGRMERTFTVRSTSGRFCGSTRITVQFSPSPAEVTVTDDRGTRVAHWTGTSGATRTLSLARPTQNLIVTVVATGTGITVSASASGDSC